MDRRVHNSLVVVSEPLPPHARGWTPSAGNIAACTRFSPARAGMDPDNDAFLDRYGLEFPPHARGWTLGIPKPVWIGHASPARAGMDPSTSPLMGLSVMLPPAAGMDRVT